MDIGNQVRVITVEPADTEATPVVESQPLPEPVPAR